MHGCLNGIGGWFQRGMAGIRPDPESPGYKKTIIKPAINADLIWVNGYHDSPYGRFTSNWKRFDGSLEMEIHIPANSSATVYIPTSDESRVREGDMQAGGAEGVTFLRQEKGHAIYQVESGEYHFVIN